MVNPTVYFHIELLCILLLNLNNYWKFPHIELDKNQDCRQAPQAGSTKVQDQSSAEYYPATCPKFTITYTHFYVNHTFHSNPLSSSPEFGVPLTL